MKNQQRRCLIVTGVSKSAYRAESLDQVDDGYWASVRVVGVSRKSLIKSMIAYRALGQEGPMFIDDGNNVGTAELISHD